METRAERTWRPLARGLICIWALISGRSIPQQSVVGRKDFCPARLYGYKDQTDRGAGTIIEDRGASNLEHRRYIAGWVAREILPHEPRVRTWFGRFRLSHDEVDELLQEAYCRIARLDSVDHIAVPHAYFFSIARNVLLRRLKRQRIIPFESIAEIEGFGDDRASSPEELVSSKLAYERVLALIAALPEKCRRIVRLRKLEGWSQREIAEHLGMSEKAVEKQIWLGVRAVRQAWDEAEQRNDMRLSIADRTAVRGK